MWARFADSLRCPNCRGTLSLQAFSRSTVRVDAPFEDLARQRGISDPRFREKVEAGLLLCATCQAMFPIMGGVPVLLCYGSPLHEQFVSRYGGRALEPYARYRFL